MIDQFASVLPRVTMATVFLSHRSRDMGQPHHVRGLVIVKRRRTDMPLHDGVCLWLRAGGRRLTIV